MKQKYMLALCFYFQRIVYMTNMSTMGVAEVQDVEAVFEIFQIGFQGAYTG